MTFDIRGGGSTIASMTGVALAANIDETVRRERRPYLAGANPARQLSLQPVALVT